MYTNIVCAIDGSELSTKALQHALTLAKTFGSKLSVLTVTDPSVIIAPGAEIMMVDTASILADLDKAKEESAKGILADAGKLAQEAGVSINPVYLPGHPAAEGIVSTAKNSNANLIVMGSHGRRGLGRLLLGSQAAEVLAHSPVPVLIVK
ncbi:MAG: universal stress protein [Devosia sp.]|nr:universal stress protein [Devosia sp.]